jgi:hypothetical protein
MKTELYLRARDKCSQSAVIGIPVFTFGSGQLSPYLVQGQTLNLSVYPFLSKNYMAVTSSSKAAGIHIKSKAIPQLNTLWK